MANPEPTSDEARKKNRAKIASYRDRHRKKGLCLWCSAPVQKRTTTDGKVIKMTLCPRHTTANRVRLRQRTGSKPWGVSGRGRRSE